MAENKYQLLIRLAEGKQKSAAERMRLAQKRLADASARMEQLQDFCREYQQRLTASGSKGINVSQWVDFQQFLGRLNLAVTQQETEVDRCRQRFLLEKQGWQNEQKKLKAYAKLLEREQDRQTLADARRQQKFMDEFAARQYWDNQFGDD